MGSQTSRRAIVRGIVGVASTFALTPLLAACQPAGQAPVRNGEGKPLEGKLVAATAQPTPAQTSAPSAQAQPTAANATESKPAAQQAAGVSTKLGGELRLHVRSGPEEPMLKLVLPKFTEATGVQVKLEAFPSADYFTKIQTLIAGGTAGDVWWSASRNTPRLAHTKVILPLDDLVQRDRFDLAAYYKGAIEGSTWNGKLYSLPFKFHPGPAGFYVNVKHAREAGVTIPEKQVPSWDEMIKLGKQLTREGGGRVERYALSLGLTTNMGGNTILTIRAFVRAWGGEVFSPDGKRSLLDQKPARDASPSCAT